MGWIDSAWRHAGGSSARQAVVIAALLLSACSNSNNGNSSPGAVNQPLATAMADSELATPAPQQPVTYCKVLRISGQLAKDVVTRQIKPGCVAGTSNGQKMMSVFLRGSPGA